MNRIEDNMSFTKFQFKNYIEKALEELNFTTPTEVQDKLIPIVLAGRDLVGESKTGSGKTHTFLLPIFQQLDETSDSVQAVITAPSRELATQIYHAARQIASHSEVEVRVVNYVGGTDKARQIDKLASNQPHIVIGTPGRIYDLVKSGDLAIHKAKTFVVDEADMTLDMGFLETVDKIAGSLPKDLQFMVFSATIPQKLQPFLKKYLSNPIMEKIKTKTVISDTIENWLISTKGRDKNAQIYELTQLMQPYLAMIFVNTKTRADELHAYLTAQGLKVAKIHGDIAPRERKRIMNQVKNLDFEYIVATDLAARGIDIEGVSHVINRPLNFLLITRFDFFLFLFNQTNHFDIKLILLLLTVGTTITVISILKFPVFDHLRSKLDSQFLQLTDIRVITWLIKGNSCAW